MDAVVERDRKIWRATEDFPEKGGGKIQPDFGIVRGTSQLGQQNAHQHKLYIPMHFTTTVGIPNQTAVTVNYYR